MTNDWLQDAGDEASSGTARKQIDLVNLTFTLKGAVLHPYTDKKTGQPAASYIGTIRLDGAEEDEEFWLGGVRVMGQVESILAKGMLPIRLRHGSIALTNGTAYNLELVSGNDAPAVREPIGKAALIAYMQRNAMTGSDVLRTLGVDPGGNPQQAWSDYIEKVIALDEVKDEDGACAMILKTLSSTTPKSFPGRTGEIPFA